MNRDSGNASPAYVAFLFIGGGIVMLISKWHELIGWAVICFGISILFFNMVLSSRGKEHGRTLFPKIIAIASFVAFVVLLVLATR
jgi:hypothetical protein